MAGNDLAFRTTKELKDLPDPADQNLQFETTTRDGRSTTVVRDEHGNIAYPAFVPPQTQDFQAKSAAGLAKPENDEPLAQPPRKTRSNPLERVAADLREEQPQRDRPSAERRSLSETAPKGPNRQYSALPTTLRRAGTNVSEMRTALWARTHGEHDDTSSSSSSEDEEPSNGPRHGLRRGAKTRTHTKTDDSFGRFRVGNENYHTKGKIKRDGRLRISVNDTSSTGYLAKAIGSAVKKVVPKPKEGGGAYGMETQDEERKAHELAKEPGTSRRSSATTAVLENVPCPKLNIVIMVIGSRGDAQPFLKIGKVLKEQYGHHVRIATHPAFREFVEKDSGLEFFSVGGDPSELMAFMVKNPGMIPTLETVKAGDIGRRRAAMAEMFEGFWRACIHSTDDPKDTQNLRLMGDKDPFIADAIIANPPSFAHYHIAEALGIPLHLMFTFPYTPTQAFPHPLASIKKSNVDPGYTNFISYPLVEMMVWQGLGDLVNDFRVKTLGLDPVSTLWAPGATYRLHVPFSYLWSPGLVPKPEDWGDEVDVSGFVFLDLASSFEPPEDLVKFLDSGDAPIYIGFGSIVVDDADRFTEMIFEAVKLAGVRALVSKGWGGLGNENIPDGIFMLENTPHDWLFPRVKACVIHGGAGTTAIALKCGLPTMVVPFFGDQHFWGSMLERCNVGPPAVPYKSLSAEKLAEGIKYLLTDEAKEAAGEIARDIELEGDGAENACRSFHKHLTLQGSHSMRCSILEDEVAAWHLKHTNIRLSALAADIIAGRGLVPWRKLKLIRHQEWNDFEGPGEPVTGLAGSVVASISDVVTGVGGVPVRIAKSSGKRKEKKKKRQEAKAKAKDAKKQEKDGKKKEPNQEPSSATKSPKDATAPKDTDAQNHAQPSKEPSSQAQKQHKDNDDASSVHTAGTADTSETNPAEDVAKNVGKGVGKSARALAKAPVDISMAVAQGFHNAPRLYGDDTVRRPLRVTGIRSGLKAAKLEFAYGLYDGFTGVVRLPVRGARDGGCKGFVKGVGMGITGFFLKNLSAIIAPGAYALKGVAKELERGKTPTKHVRRARIIQAQRAQRRLSKDDYIALQKRVVEGWGVLRDLTRALEEAQRLQKGGIAGRLSARRRRGIGAAFESVEIARRALEAVKRGDLETVVERGAQRQDDGKGKVEKKVKKERKKMVSEHAGEKRKETKEREDDEEKEPESADMGSKDKQGEDRAGPDANAGEGPSATGNDKHRQVNATEASPEQAAAGAGRAEREVGGENEIAKADFAPESPLASADKKNIGGEVGAPAINGKA
ncbi:hypothetical protein RB595_000650 [Gaeumannomyces hyphopodioides]